MTFFIETLLGLLLMAAVPMIGLAQETCEPSTEEHTFWDVIKWQLTRENRSQVERLKDQIPYRHADVELLRHPGKAPQITWIGHSTVLIQYRGMNILTDPMFSERASPVQFFGIRRYTEPALSIPELPPIDIVVVSHNHYDHLVSGTVAALGNAPLWVVPRGIGSWLRDAGITHFVELEWWQETQYGLARVVCTPSQHWSRRGFFDVPCTLWASWAFIVDDFRCWFAGDTGYDPVAFKEIGKRFGPFDCALIPIGGYEPRWFMKRYHVDPEEAVEIHKDVKSKWSVGIHWGTFALTDEPITEPRERLEKALRQQGLDPAAFVTLSIGETASPPEDL